MLYLGSDHGGFSLKQRLMSLLETYGVPYTDKGTFSEASCDYPQFAIEVAKSVQKNGTHRGVLICTSGVGMCIAANKFKGIYAACLTTPEAVIKARQHNGINVLCLPGNLTSQLAYDLVHSFLSTDVDPGERHKRRRRQIIAIETAQSSE